MSSLTYFLKASFEPIRSLDYSSISSALAAIGTPFDNPVRILEIQNFTNANLLIGFGPQSFSNDVDINIAIAANSGKIYDFGSNKSTQAGILEQSVGKVAWVKQEGSAPTSGKVYVTVIYASK